MIYLVLDDHPSIVEFISAQLSQFDNKAIIVKAYSVEEAQRLLNKAKIDKVICDLQIRTGKSMVIPEICCDRKIPFMVFSSYVNPTLAKNLERLGCRVYVSKAATTDEVMEGIRVHISGGSFYCEQVASVIKSTEITILKPILSKAETPVIDGFYHGLTAEEISEKNFISVTTVRNHRARAMERNHCNFYELLHRYGFWEK